MQSHSSCCPRRASPSVAVLPRASKACWCDLSSVAPAACHAEPYPRHPVQHSKVHSRHNCSHCRAGEVHRDCRRFHADRDRNLRALLRRVVTGRARLRVAFVDLMVTAGSVVAAGAEREGAVEMGCGVVEGEADDSQTARCLPYMATSDKDLLHTRMEVASRPTARAVAEKPTGASCRVVVFLASLAGFATDCWTGNLCQSWGAGSNSAWVPSVYTVRPHRRDAT